MSGIEKMNLESEDLVNNRLTQLKELMPEVFTESGIDFDKLRLELGDEVDEGQERYSFTWPGKAEAIRQAQKPSKAVLRPDEDASVDWDTTENLYIEGDNLEVLKLLQRGYHGKVKMIYIDPPYNTGHDFVYKDSFQDSIAHYKEQAGLSRQSNADTSGRYHSDWLSMMYPRLRLARELLGNDGICIVSIDDNEIKNLREVGDEIFGETNLMGTLQWRRRQNPDSRNQTRLSPDNEYLLVYAKSSDASFRGAEIDIAKYKNPDNDPRGPWASIDLSGLANASQRPNLHFDIVDPKTGVAYPPNPNRGWSKSRDTIAKMIDENRILFPSKSSGRPREKKFLSDLNSTFTGFSTWLDSDVVGFTTHGTRDFSDMFGGKLFDFPKPVNLVKLLIAQCVDSDGLVLDFFSGSATTAQAVMELNAEDLKKRKFLLVQLPEVANDEAIQSGLQTLCDIGEERIRRAGQKIKAEIEKENTQLKLGEEPKSVPDIGFRVFKLDESGIERPEPGQLALDVVKPDRSELDIVFEMMLKWGLELTLPVEKADAAGYPIWSVACDELICCMSNGLSLEALEAVAELEPRRVLILDSVLDDSLKLNAVQIFKRASERMGCEIDLRTV
ncbi:site-specific DNA-methyltransferase [Paraeggerthella sp. LCP19S3_G8]|uniref:site-specific DNA-methyltransferase n=1 Tax=Paraeggerthella sp. LCP19S3_G8 TaxID=3440248 RepID=UPI003F97D9D4